MRQNAPLEQPFYQYIFKREKKKRKKRKKKAFVPPRSGQDARLAVIIFLNQ
jgi:hypothetical protein